MSGDNGSTERRRFPRVSASVDVLSYEGTQGVGHGELTDISQGGLRLVTTAAEQPGTRVRMRLRLKHQPSEAQQAADELDVQGQVVWARQAPPYHTGIRFIRLVDRGRQLIAQLASDA